MKKQRGGLKLKNPDKKGFTPIYDMLNSPSCFINLLTYKSLKGFMIYLDVSEDDSEYIGIQGKKFTNPVSSYLLKFAVITPNNDQGLPDYKTVRKSSESKKSYFEEAKLQQKIWKNSISGGRPEICPPVANFSLFDNNNSTNLLKFLKSKTRVNVKEIFNYLLDCVKSNTDYGIGIITMPKIENSITFGDFIYSPSNTNFYGLTINTESKNKVYSSVLAKIVRLFIDIGIIHFDLHTGNALIYKKGDDQINSLIIDFGRASDLTNDTPDEYLTDIEKQNMIKEKNKYYNQLFRMLSPSEPEKTRYMEDILNIIAVIDRDTNQRLFKFTDLARYQMDWYENLPTNQTVLANAFDLLKTSIEIEIDDRIAMTPQTIKSYETSGYLINFNTDDVDSFVVPFTGPNCDENTGFCVISGGKKRTRKIKKYRRSRKNRKSKKRNY